LLRYRPVGKLDPVMNPEDKAAPRSWDREDLLVVITKHD